MGVELKNKPFFLNEEQINFVKQKLEQMTLDEKIGQLFLPINHIEDASELAQFVKKYQPAGVLNRPASGAQNLKKHGIIQKNAKVPMLIPANIESGGNGIATEGTAFGNPLQVAATANCEYAYNLGKIAGIEGRAVGVNYAFAPIIDIDYNTLNPITNTRTFGSNPQLVCDMASAYIKGLMEDGKDMCYSIKHFPGDGVDNRDQHLHTTYNTLSVPQWEATFGKNYAELIEKGAPTVMVGHIGFPEYVKQVNPNATKKQILAPASLSKEIVTGLLREKLQFNGVIITDSTSMNGFYAHMPRHEAVPTAIANGCDIFLFNYNVEEDYNFMKEGIEKGILSLERINEAVTRTLGLKMSMGLFEKQAKGSLVPQKEALSVLGKHEFTLMAQACAKQAVTLVKDEENNLPINAKTHKKVILYVMGDREDFYGNQKIGQQFMEKMQKEGFEVDLFDYGVRFPNPSETTKSFTEKYDVAIYILNEGTSSNRTTVRLSWNLPLANDAPWFVNDMPVIAISFANPYHLRDMPQVKTFINAYTTNSYNVEAVIDKILGRSPFVGVSPVDTNCDCYELNFQAK